MELFRPIRFRQEIKARRCEEPFTYRLIEEIAGQDLSGLEGTVLWICRSPFRKNHKRKNWYVDVSIISEQTAMEKLQEKLADLQKEQEAKQKSAAWRETCIVRGNPVRVYEGERFTLIPRHRRSGIVRSVRFKR